jgi:hypothetical protein
MSAHRPGTPLPWRVGDAGHGVFGPPNGKPAPEMVADVRRADNCRFIVHAANAYPKLVAALKDLQACADPVRDAKELKATRALLRELGEL